MLYPNPTDGSQPFSILVPLATPADVNVRIFTTAFRKILERDFLDQPVGVPVSVTLDDREGKPLASGLYYVVVTTRQGKSIGKLLLIR